MTPQFLLLPVSIPALPLPQNEPPAERLINGLALFIILLLVGLCLIACIAVLAALLPQVSQRSKAALLRSPWRAFFIGLANYIFLGAISLLLVSVEVELLGLLGLLIFMFLGVISLLGLPGLVLLTGERLAKLREREMSPWQQLIWGTIALELTGLLPILGWFVLTPILLLLSFGAAVLAWRSRAQKEAWE